MRRPFLLALLSMSLAGCGPKTVASIIFPTLYPVTTVLAFDDGGRRSSQTVVSACKVIDQTDSIAANIHVEKRGERHWLRRADGSLWVISSLDPCRWGPKGPRGETGFRPLLARRPAVRDAGWTVPDDPTLRFDNPTAPTEIELWSTPRLFDTGGAGLRLSGRLAATGGEPTDTLPPAFPFLGQVAAAEAAAKAAAKASPNRSRTAERAVMPGAFSGFRATARHLQKGACDTPDPGAAGPVVLPADAECQYNSRPCSDNPTSERPCHIPFGGLRPSIASDYRRIDFRLDDRDPAFLSRLLETRRLAAAGAPGSTSTARFEWSPELCFDGQCFKLERFGRLLLYYPARNVLVEAAADAASTSPYDLALRR